MERWLLRRGHASCEEISYGAISHTVTCFMWRHTSCGETLHVEKCIMFLDSENQHHEDKRKPLIMVGYTC